MRCGGDLPSSEMSSSPLPIPPPRKRTPEQRAALELQLIAQMVESEQCFVVLTHVRPDGDAIGSAIALTRALRQLGKDVVLWHSEGIPSSYSFLEGDWALAPPADIGERVALVLDCGDRSRVADTLPDGSGLLEQALLSVNIDHHDTNPRFADLNAVFETLPATAQILPQLFDYLGVELTAAIAAPLYVGLYTDTGNFRYRSVSKASFALRDRLGAVVELGPLEDKITFYPASWLAYAGRCEQRVRKPEPEVALAVMLAADLAECEVAAGATQEAGSLAKEALQRTEALLHIFCFEQPDGTRLVSLRCQSEVVHAGEIAARFGGGGHRAAAGFTTELAAEEIAAEILAAYRAARNARC